MTNDRQVVIRVPANTVSRAKALVRPLAQEHAGLRVAWSTVLRMALLRGLEDMEAEAKHRRSA
jgi:hypothetical protein